MADLERFPVRPGDNVAQCAGVDDELWERQWLASAEIEATTGIVHRVESGKRSSDGQVFLWGCYQERLSTGRCPPRCCGGSCCNLAARPGTSKHELGLAIDFTNRPRNHPISTEIFYKWGIHFPVWGKEPEPWHGELVPNRAPLPAQPPILIPERADMPVLDDHTAGGISAEARVFLDHVNLHFTTEQNPVLPLAPWGSLHDRGVPVLPVWCDGITVTEHPDGRFVIVARQLDTGLAFAAYQREGTTGPPHEWEPAWFPAS